MNAIAISTIGILYSIAGCTSTGQPPGDATDSPLGISFEFPSDPKVRLRYIKMHLSNHGSSDIRILDSAHALNTGLLKISVAGPDGQPLDQLSPLPTGPPEAPQESDYRTVGPKESISEKLPVDIIQHAYHLQASRLYFITVEIAVEGQAASSRATIPYGFTSGDDAKH